ncbi:MAG TPA: SoxR reducing system RseC family protein [Patescibacteria group bacterium]|nr:SoxR reducing system RseC family protein [Patescibacteria group bacterium]
MENTGKVVSISGKTAYVQVKRASACGGDCGKCIGCAATGTTVKLENNISAKEGDLVKIVSKRNNLLTAVLYVYIIPLIVFFASYIMILNRLTDTVEAANIELMALTGATITMATCYYALKQLSKKLSISRKFELQLEKFHQQ